MLNATKLIESAKKFFDGRWKCTRAVSWEHCYEKFYDKIKNNADYDDDYLALNLAFYLASWGMYRPSSFLIDYDYKIHIPVVQEILKPEYKVLCGISCENLATKENLDLLQKLSDKIKKDCYKSYGKPTSTLVTKILMGTLGCTPAYDTNFSKTVKEIASSTYNTKSIQDLITFWKSNKQILESQNFEIRKGLPYPQMKILDMCLWQYGVDDKS